MSEETTWGAVNEGDVIEGSNGSLWTVLRRAADKSTTVVNVVTGKEVTSTPDDAKPVVRVVRAATALGTARALTQVVLGGQDVGTRTGEDDWRVPAEFTHPGALLAHLMIFHGVQGKSVAGRTLPMLEPIHAAVHEPGQRGTGYVEHIHDPRYAQRAS